MLPEDYLIDITLDNSGAWCALCITSIEGFDEWILGDAFMRGYYNIHDHTTTPNRMGFVPFTGSSKVAPTTAGITPTDPIPDVTLTNVGYLIFGIDSTVFWVLFFIFLFATIGSCVACFCLFSKLFFTFSGGNKSVIAEGKRILERRGQATSKNDSESQISLIYLQ